MCGEKFPSKLLSVVILGSPPHVRGKVALIVLIQSAIGITPACAGKSFALHFFRFEVRDHPRMCGEKFRMSLLAGLGTGSPPHVRGKVFCSAIAFACAGITPACAGKSLKKKYAEIESKDHPRMCGEKFL